MSQHIAQLNQRSQADMSLVMFPYAGSGPFGYRAITQHMDDDVRCFSVCLPGRANCYKEPALNSVAEVVDLLLPDIAKIVEGPCIFFGHSFGAVLAYEIAAILQRTGRPMPQGLFVSGKAYMPFDREPIHHLPSAAFMAGLKEYGGIPPGFTVDQVLVDFCGPALRADFCALENHHYSSDILDIPIVTFSGEDDKVSTPVNMVSWELATKRHVSHYRFSGNHFFIEGAGHAIAGLLKRHIPQRVETEVKLAVVH